MVKTRHNQEADDETEGCFLSLNERRNAKHRAIAQSSQDDSDDSGVINFRRPSQQIEDEQFPKRSSRAAAKRVTYVEDYVNEDTDSDIDFHRQTRHGRHNVTLKPEVDEDDDGDDDDDGEDNDVDRRPPRGRGRVQGIKRSPGRPRRTRRNSDYLVAHPSPKQVKMEHLAELDDSRTRRSSRTRRVMYDSYDNKMLENSYEEEPMKKRRRREVVNEESQDNDNDGYTDIYSRVKRQRKVVKRDMYGMPIETDNEEVDDQEEDDEVDSSDDGDDNGENNDENEDDNDDDDDDDENESEEKKTRRSYNLRENKPRTQHYIAPIQERRQRVPTRFFSDEVPAPHSPQRRRRTRPDKMTYMSPARRRRGPINRRRRAFHGSSSTSSSSSDSSSSDEERFQRRKAKSMLKARQRCLPMNFDPDDISRSTLLKDRQKIGSSLADVDPMNIDKSVTFNSVGGLGKHIRALKEMVVFPLLYPEIFDRFKISPPRGVLFYGPPGTGKTLVARALANECSSDDRRVAFYMRKGADCLSKWVGESERQLRLLFDQAYQTRPSIIFFDEIDGLAPVRSSRQDQIHSSIVSTLLALMDGLDSRGEIVVIGATNRLDSIDPALRRPGRFDREFLFPLPSIQARRQILKINTKEWNPKLCEKFLYEVAEKCTGYCGADMKALCTEVALLALRRRYPQIYTSSEKLQIDVTSIYINAKDFHNAMKSIVPASQRSVTSPARSLSVKILPLLLNLYQQTLKQLNRIFPSILTQLSNLDAQVTEKSDNTVDVEGELCSDDDERDVNIYEHKVDKRRKNSNIPELPETFLNFTSYAYRHPSTHRPRVLLSGRNDQGQSSYLAPAIIHHLEQLPVHTLDLSTLYAVEARTPEESCAHIFREAKRSSPSIIYMPHVNHWWSVVSDTVKASVLTLIRDLDPSIPVLLLATSEEDYSHLDFDLQDLFDEHYGEVVTMRNPKEEERRDFFKDLLLNQATKPPVQRKVAAQRLLEVLPKAPPPEPRKLTEQELKKLHEHEEATLTELRLFLRDTLNKLGRDRKFFIFTKPVDIEDVPDYYDIIKKPMDLSTMMSKIDLHHYQSVKEFLADIEQICMNALEYNPDKDPQSRVIRHRACALKDTAYAIIKTELDKDFEKICESIVESRKVRGEEGTKTAPSFYHTKPLNVGPMHPLAITKQSTSNNNTPRDLNVRTSRRLQGAEADNGPSLEDVEKSARALKRLQKSPSKEQEDNATPQGQLKKNTPTSRDSSGLKPSRCSTSGNKNYSSSKSSSAKKPVKKDIWGSKSYRSRKRRYKRKRLDSDDDDFKELPDDDNDVDEDVDSVGEENDEEMDVEEEMAPDGTVHVSPRRETKNSPRRSSTDKSAENKSPHREPITSCLSVDVHMKSPKESAKSPNQRSPRGESQKSPRSSSRSQNESPSRSRSPRSDPGYMTQRHTSGGRVSRSHDGQNVSAPDTEQKSPRNIVNSPDKMPKQISPTKVVDSQESSSVSISEKQVPSSIDKDKVKSLLNGFVDSGVGSSDNGDSNDSVGKLTTSSDNSDKVTTINNTAQGTSEQNNQSNLDGNSPEKETSPIVHVTRSRVQTRAQEKAVEVINELKQPLVIDRERLVRLLDLTVLLTEDYIIPRLEKLYTLFAQCVYEHRQDYNKTALIESMEARLKQYTSSIAAKIKAEQSRTVTS
ncbi:ATPase family AAA domain-containing protein 2-like isoform X2 [Ruditapes philippinarum]|uniref:ATPase family AAA domain-containing protein 2-like isoform X2 n=1 Tax=Ruditapes philippinarum TaxID=129788 RepID=UPI00295B4F55|nr:ATPase family AAA domain-containing protein 2-like isoform X2 [Ruditapes philippinarum]